MRLATYNVKNLFRDGAAERAKPDREFSSLVGSVNKLGADVLLLQEVGSRAALNELNARLKSPYAHADVLLGNSDRDIHLAILSRRPFCLTSHRERTLTSESGEDLLEFACETDARAGTPSLLKIQRDLMLAEVETREFGTVAVFNVHLKSKTNRDWRLLAAELVRSAECRLIAAILSGYIRQHPERGVYLLGDFNDTRHSDALRPLFAVPLTDPVGDVVMRNGGNPSTYWPRRRMRIDFILASDRGERLLLADTGFIHRSQQARRASDHFPVSVDLNPASTDLREMVESGITPKTTRPGFPDHSTAGRQDRADSSGSCDCPHLV